MNASATEDNGQVIAKIGCDNIQMTAQQAQMLGEQLIEAAHLARNGCWHHNAPTIFDGKPALLTQGEI